MAKVYLDSGDNFALSGAASVFGSTGTEKVVINTGVTGVVVDANVERVDLSGASSTYTFQQAGNQLKVFSGTTLVATIPLQDDANGTQVVFSNGSVEAKVGATGLTLGGAVVPSATAAAVTPTTIDAAVTSGSGTVGGAVTGQAFTLTTGSTDAPVLTTGNDTITGGVGTIQDTDRLIDTSASDSDVFNATLNVATAKPQIINVETLNINGEYTSTGFDFTNTVGAKVANFTAGISGATAAITNVTATRVAEIKAGSNIGTLTVSAGTDGTAGTIKFNSGSATSVTATGTAAKTNTFDITVGAAATSLVMDADTGTDTFSVTLAGNTMTTFNTDAGKIENLTIKSSGAANTLTLNGTDLLATAVATTATAKAVLSGDQSLTIKGSIVGIDGVRVQDTTTAGTTTFTTNAAIASDSNLSKAAFDVFNIANSSAANTLTINDGTTVKLSADLTADVTFQVQNDAATLTATDGSGGTLMLDVGKTQAAKLITGDKVDTLKLSDASASAAVTLAELDVTNTATTTLTGAKDMTVTLLTGADNSVFSASAFTGKLTLTNTSANKLVVVGGTANDSLTITAATAGTVVRGGDGADTIVGNVLGGALFGDAGNDTITGAAAADTISGGDGDDVITGGLLADILTGGAGADKFVIDADVKGSAGVKADYITDFVGGTDKILLVSTNTSAVAAIADLRTLAAVDQAKVNAAATVAAAATEAFTSVGAAYKAAASGVVIFNYNADTYAVIETAGVATFADAADYLVKITGVTGTLAATDFLIA